MKKSSKNKRHILITGGAGFIGINTADHFLSRGWRVSILDNLSRAGGRKNLQWLQKKHGAQSFRFHKADVVSDIAVLDRVVAQVDAVIHLAAQVAVTTSVQEPHHDFRNNALGTLNVLEAIRLSKHHPALLYASTNKVYGGMHTVKIRRTREGYRYHSLAQGVSETFPMDFHSPYGCSKGAADQYVRDYSRIYGLDTVVFRQSCIYGPRQFGVEDQGWVAWFAIAAVTGRPITIYGDGWQVRDVLHVSDLCRLYESALINMKKVRGKVYNIGGGPTNLLSLRQTLSLIDQELGGMRTVAYADWRPGDQRIYTSDIRKITKELGWRPRISVTKGVSALVRWVKANRALFR